MPKSKKVLVYSRPGESLLIEFSPKIWPVPKKCHFHIAVGEEPCPNCGSVVMVYYAVTSEHRSNVLGVHAGMASCVNCGWVGFTDDVMKKVNEAYEKLEDVQKQLKQLEKMGQVKPRKNIGEV